LTRPLPTPRPPSRWRWPTSLYSPTSESRGIYRDPGAH
jgi:hypothetical protein